MKAGRDGGQAGKYKSGHAGRYRRRTGRQVEKADMQASIEGGLAGS